MSKPSTAHIDYSNPLASGLISAYLCLEASGSTTADSLQPDCSMTVNQTITDATEGICKTCGDYNLNAPLPISLANGIPSMTFMTRFAGTADGQFECRALLVQTSQGSVIIQLDLFANTQHFVVANFQSTNLVTDSTFTLSGSTVLDLTYTISYDSTTQVATVYNGANSVGTTALAVPIGSQYPLAWVPLMYHVGGNTPATAFSYAWDRALSAQEVAQVNSNPYAMWTTGTNSSTKVVEQVSELDNSTVLAIAVAARQELDANSTVQSQILSVLQQILAKL